MSVRIARNSGFCFGVKRAIRLAMETSREHESIVTLGPIIHNPQMVDKLKAEGIESVDHPDEIRGRTTIIRSHGLPKDELSVLEKLKVKIIDATCPYVSKTQQYGFQLSRENYTVIILGNADHPEVIALKSFIDGEVIIVKNAGELEQRQYSKIGVICQTTQNIENLRELVVKLLDLSNEVRVINTICNATSIRQESTLELARKSDVMIVIGGRNSSNTKMLAEISQQYVETWPIETAEELSPEWFEGKTDIGITAGASTPDWIILDVYNKINKVIGDSEADITRIEDIPGYKEEGNVF